MARFVSDGQSGTELSQGELVCGDVGELVDLDGMCACPRAYSTSLVGLNKEPLWSKHRLPFL